MSIYERFYIALMFNIDYTLINKMQQFKRIQLFSNVLNGENMTREIYCKEE